MKDRNLFLDSKTIPRTFNALEAKLGKKPKRKIYNEVATDNNFMAQEKAKNKVKVKDGLPPNKRFSLTPFS